MQILLCNKCEEVIEYVQSEKVERSYYVSVTCEKCPDCKDKNQELK